MTHVCKTCDNTGSRAKSMYGPLDCGHCDVAGQRAALAEFITTQRDEPHVLAWRVHLRALAIAAGKEIEPPRAQVLQLFRSRG